MGLIHAVCTVLSGYSRRQGEINALHYLSSRARARTAPLVDLPTGAADDPQSLEEHAGAFIADLTPAWGTEYPIYVDLTRYHPGQTDRRGRHIAEHLFDCARQLRLKAIPVAGTLSERGPGAAYLEAVAKVAKQAGRGAALRISHADYSDPDVLNRELAAGLENLSLMPEQVDLFLGAESIVFMPVESASEGQLLAELSEAFRVCERYRFRSAIFIGSSVPENLRGPADGKPLTFSRTELRVWKQYMSRPAASLLLFGDTGVWNPRQPDTGGGGGGPPPARVRIPLEDEQVFFRGESTGYRGLCKKALEYPGALDIPRCWGLDSIRRAESGSGGADNATGWVARHTNVHIEATVRQVEQFLQRHNRLSEVLFALVRSEPWQQESWTEVLNQDDRHDELPTRDR
jgi:hypothetical protein